MERKKQTQQASERVTLLKDSLTQQGCARHLATVSLFQGFSSCHLHIVTLLRALPFSFRKLSLPGAKNLRQE